jgi:probable HAF family extracellular repeat protein
MPASGHGINDVGQIAGTAYAADRNLAFRYTPGIGNELLADLAGSSSAYGVGINRRGQVSGSFDFADGSRHGFRYTDGVGMQDLGHLGGNYTTALPINNLGWVAGSSTLADGASRAFLWKDDVGMIDLGAGMGTALNNLGVVGGRSYDGQPMIFREGQDPIALSGLPGLYYVSDINDQNVLVGGITYLDGRIDAYVATEADGILILNDLIDPDSGWNLNYALGINNLGQIVGEGYWHGESWAFRLDPIPEPSTWGLFALGAGFLWVCRRGRKP